MGLKSVCSPRGTLGEDKPCSEGSAARTPSGESLAFRTEIGFINTHLQEAVSVPLFFFISAEFLLDCYCLRRFFCFVFFSLQEKKCILYDMTTDRSLTVCAPGTQRAEGLMSYTPLEESCHFFLGQMGKLLLSEGTSEGWRRAELV